MRARAGRAGKGTKMSYPARSGLSRRIRALCCGMLGAVALSFAQPAAAAGPASPADKAAMEQVIRDYLLENPEIIMEAIAKLREKKQLAEQQADRQAVASNTDVIYRDPTSPVGGNPAGDVTIVEFFDYRCGVCRRVHPIVKELVDGDKNIRRVYKEWPILGADSVIAARAAIAAQKQGKYFELHTALMQSRTSLEEPSILRIAATVGLDVDRLRKDMGSAETNAILQRNYELAEKLKLNGTPSFLIGDRLIRGGQDLESMRAIVAQIREKK
jgi:protein-disulfide isomerase